MKKVKQSIGRQVGVSGVYVRCSEGAVETSQKIL